MSYVISAADAIAKALRPGQLVILESTTYPGTTEELVLPALEAGGLVPEGPHIQAARQTGPFRAIGTG